MASSTRTVNVKFDGDAKGLQRAAKDGEREIDRMTKSVDKKFRKSGDESGKGFGASLKKWFKGDGTSVMKEIGKQGGTVFGSGFLGMLKTPVLGPAIIATLGVAVAVAAPAVGAIAAAGIVSGFGAGLAGLGLVFAAKSEQVKAAWSKTLSDMGADMRVLSKPFEQTLLAMTVVARRTFDAFKPALDKAFKQIAPALTVFGDQVGRALEGLAPAVEPLADAFTAVLRTLGPAMQYAVGKVTQGLQDLAASVKKNPEALADMIRGVGDVSKSLLDLITHMNEVNSAFSRITGGTSLVDVAMKHISGSIGSVDLALRAITAPITVVDAGLQKVGLRSKDSATGTRMMVKATGDLIPALGDAGTKVESLATKFERQWRATQKANEELFRNSGLLLTLSGSQIAYQAALDDATASQKENGRTLNINTAAGRANRTALDSVAAAANTQTEAMRNANDGNAAATKHALGARAAFVKQATSMGMSKKEAEALATSLISLPPKADTKVTVTGADGAKGSVDALANSIRLLPGYKNIQIKYTSTGVPTNVIGSEGRRASGGLTQPRRSYLVGERGPEVLTMGNTGGRVTSNERLGQGGSAPIIVENHIEIGGEVVRVVKTEIKANDRNTTRREMAGVRV